MKRTLPLLCLALAALPGAARAQADATGDVAIDGRVAELCILGDPVPATVDLGVLAATSGPRAGKIAVLPAQVVSLPGSFCNFAGSVVRVDATALVSDDTATPQPGFTRAVNYTATASGWAAGDAAATTAALSDGTAPTSTGSSAIQPLPHVADISVTLANFTAPGDQILVAGNYHGIVVVTLGAAATD